MAVITCARFTIGTPAGLGRQSGDSIFVLAPRTVLVERFYRSRRRHEAGETARTLHHSQITGPISQPEDLRVPAAVLLRYAIRKDETAKTFLGPMTSSGFSPLAHVGALFLPNFCHCLDLAATSSMPSARQGRLANWPQESLYLFQSPSMALAISLAAERNQFDFLRRRSLRMLATWRLLPR